MRRVKTGKIVAVAGGSFLVTALLIYLVVSGIAGESTDTADLSQSESKTTKESGSEQSQSDGREAADSIVVSDDPTEGFEVITTQGDTPDVEARTIVGTVEYGDGADQLLLSQGDDPQGPSTFSVDGESNWYIADTTRQEILVVNGLNTHRFTIHETATDIAATQSGTLMVMDAGARKVREYSSTGAPGRTYHLMEVAGELVSIRTIGDEGYVATNDQSEYLLDGGEVTRLPGLFGPSGNHYRTAVEAGQAILRYAGPDGEVKDIDLAIETPASLVFLGEAEDGSVYLQVERFTASLGVELSVLRVKTDGELLNRVVVMNDFHVFVTKMIEIGPAVQIRQAIPRESGVELSLWAID